MATTLLAVKLGSAWCLVLIAGALGCGGETAPAPRAPAAARVETTIQIPRDAVAVMDVDILRVRKSALWHLVRRVVERQSSLATSCPGTLATAQHATIGLRWHDETAVFAVIRGVDRASTLACLRAPRSATLAAAGPLPSDTRPQACQRFDDAIHGFMRCRVLPLSLSGALERAQRTLVDAPPDDAAGACTRALAIIEQLNARKAELGWPCAPDEASQTKAGTFQDVRQIGPSTFELDGVELVHFVDDRTVVTVRAGPRAASDPAADLRAMLARTRTPRWYDASRATRDASRAIWLAIDPAQLEADKPHDEDHDGAATAGANKPALPRIAGTIDIERDVTLDLQIFGASFQHAYPAANQLGQLIADPMYRGATLAATCSGPTPGGPRATRCTAALAPHRAVLGDPGSLAEHVMFDAAVHACVERPWTDRQLDCVGAATGGDAFQRCGVADDLGLPGGAPMCGARAIQLRIGLPLLVVESLKLTEDIQPRMDCSMSPHLPEQVVVGPADVHARDKLPFAASMCSANSGCTHAVDLSATHVGHDDGRWYDDVHAKPRCLGPFNLGLRWRVGHYRIDNRCDDTLVTLELKAKTATLCRPRIEPGCLSFPISGPIHEVSVNTGARLAAIVRGAPGAQSIETWDLVTKQRVGQFAAGTTRQRPCARAQLLDGTLLVDTGACAPTTPPTATAPAPPADAAYLATPQGKRLAAVGGDHPLAILGSPLWLAGSRWAFIASTGDAVVIHDVATGAVERRIATGAPVEPGMVAAGADPRGHVVLVYGGATPRAGGLTVVDVAGGKTTAIPPRSPCAGGVAP